MRIAAGLLCLCTLAAGAPLRIARFDGPSAHLAADLNAVSIDHLWAPPGAESFALPGIQIVRATPIKLREMSAGGNPVVLTGGQWPGLRSTIVLDQQKDIGFAAPTAEPWITENGWMLLCARGIAPEAQLVLAYDPPKDAMHKIGAYALAIAEAAVFGGSYAVPSTALRNDGAARARADCRRTIAQLKFIADRPAWFSGAHDAPVAVLADNSQPPTETMNLLVRRNLPFQAITRKRWPAERPAVLVLIGQPRLQPAERDKVNAWRSAGTAVRELSSPPDPSNFAAEVRGILGDRRPFRLTNAQQVIGFLTAGGDRVLHLLNYGIDPIQDVRVQLSQPPARATLFSPEEPAGKPLEIRQGEVSIPEMGAYCAVRFE
jgi:hypothetical protein